MKNKRTREALSLRTVCPEAEESEDIRANYIHYYAKQRYVIC